MRMASPMLPGLPAVQVQRHDLGRAAVGRLDAVAEHRQHARDVGLVLVAQLHRLFVLAGVVVAVGQAQAALDRVGDVLLGVHQVLEDAHAEQDLRAFLVQVEDHAQQLVDALGVVDPLDDAADIGEGVGTRVTIQDAAGAPMADFIIGKTVKDRDGVRYVRIPGRDRTYTTAVDTTPLTTRFQDWIEEDLLQLQPFDIREIIINDYTIDEVNQRLVQGDRIALNPN